MVVTAVGNVGYVWQLKVLVTYEPMNIGLHVLWNHTSQLSQHTPALLHTILCSQSSIASTVRNVAVLNWPRIGLHVIAYPNRIIKIILSVLLQEVESARHFLILMQPTQCMDGLRSGSDLKFSSEIVLRLGVTVCLNNSVTKFRCIGLATRLALICLIISRMILCVLRSCCVTLAYVVHWI